MAITWTKDVVTFCIDGKVVSEVRAERLDTSVVQISLTTLTPRLPVRVATRVLQDMNLLLNFFSGLATAKDQATLQSILQHELDVDTFEIESVAVGSFNLRIKGPAVALQLAKKYLNDFLAIINGYSKRLAEAHVRQKEADADISRARADRERMRAIADSIETLQRVESVLAERFRNLTADERRKLVAEFLVHPATDLADIVLEQEGTLVADKACDRQA